MPKPKQIQMHEFLSSLMDNPKKSAAFRAVPEKVVAKSNLSEEHKKIILSKDPKRIQAAVQAEVGPATKCFAFIL
jgi:hypothetical protein